MDDPLSLTAEKFNSELEMHLQSCERLHSLQSKTTFNCSRSKCVKSSVNKTLAKISLSKRFPRK